jgi:hypothetical protein
MPHVSARSVGVRAEAALDHARVPRSSVYDFRAVFLSPSSGMVFLNLFWCTFARYFQHNSVTIQQTLIADVAKIYAILRREMDE